MTAIATSRIVAEFYQDIDFPDDWADKPAFITVGMARDRVFSTIILLDFNMQPLAACWQVANREERFVRIRFDEGTEGDLLDGLDGDLRDQSRKVGTPDLFATMLWEPDELNANQGIRLHLPETAPFGMPTEWGWNVSTREIVSKASELLLIARRSTNDLSLAVPESTKEMHQDAGEDEGETFVVLPVNQSRGCK